jgi:hypothetical protein
MFKFHLVILIVCAANCMLIAVNGDEDVNELQGKQQEEDFLAEKIRFILIDPDFLAFSLHQQMAVINVLRAMITKNLEESRIRKENKHLFPSLPVLYED